MDSGGHPAFGSTLICWEHDYQNNCVRMNGSTESEYLNFAKTKNFLKIPTLRSSRVDLKVHWLGSKTAEKSACLLPRR